MRQISAETAEKNRERTKLWAKKNADKKKANDHNFRSQNAAHIKTYAANWYKQNKEKQLKLNAEWKSKNSEKVKQLKKAWREANKDLYRTYKQTRRAAKNGGKLSPDLVGKLYLLQKGKCICCGAELNGTFHLDHIIPLSKGGPNEDWNIQLLLPSCNNQKGAKDPIEFMQSRGFLI